MNQCAKNAVESVIIIMGVIKESTSITNTIAASVAEQSSILTGISGSILDVEDNINKINDDINDAANNSRDIVNNVSEVSGAVSDIARSSSEISIVSEGISKDTEKISFNIKDIAKTSKEILEVSNDISKAVNEINTSGGELFKDSIEIKKAIDKLSNIIRKIEPVMNHFHLAVGILDEPYKVIEKYYEIFLSGNLSEAKAKEKAIEELRTIKCGSYGYYWVIDYDYLMIMNPGNPGLEGKTSINLIDGDGKSFIQAFFKIFKERGEGCYDYKWPKPGEKLPAVKRSYFKGFEPWKWMICAGYYMDDWK